MSDTVGNYITFTIEGKTRRAKIFKYVAESEFLFAQDISSGTQYRFERTSNYGWALSCHPDIEVPDNQDIIKEKSSYWLNY